MNIKGNFINSKNLYHVVKKKNINSFELNGYLTKHPEFNRLLGALPYDWIRVIPKNEIKKCTENVAAAFSEFAQAITDIYTRDPFTPVRGAKLRLKKPQKFLVQKLKEFLQRQDVSVDYIDSGAYKHCHKITVGDYSYALSTFINNNESFFMSNKHCDYFNKYFQGKGYEPQNIFTFYKNGEQGRWVKPFISKVARVNDTDSFILSKFIEKSRPQKHFQGLFERKHLKIKNNDCAIRNIINGVCIDSGGCIPNNNYIEDTELRHYSVLLARGFDRANNIFENYKYRYLDKLVANDINNDVDIFHKDYLKMYILSPAEKRVMLKILDCLKLTTKLLIKIEERGLYDSIMDILSNDLKEECPYIEEISYGLKNYYSKSFSSFLGITNKVPFKDILLQEEKHYVDISVFTLKRDYRQDEVIEGLIQAWKELQDKEYVLKFIIRDFSITKEQLNYIKKEGEKFCG